MKVKDKTIGGVTMAQNLTYTRCGDYLIPDIRLSYTSDKPLGKYGRMRRAYLEQNNPMLLDDCSRPKKRLIFFVTVPIDSTFKSFLVELVGEQNIFTFSQYIERKSMDSWKRPQT